MVKNLLFTCFFIASTALATVEVEVTPKESNGEPITLRFTLKNEEDFQLIKKPLSGLEWDVQGPQQVTNSQFIYSGGEAKQLSSVSLTFLLFPKRKGQLAVPQAQIKVKDKIYSSPPISIRVAKLAQESTPGKSKNSPNFPIFPLDQDDNPPPINMAPAETSKLEVAVVAEPSKTSVYAGELIVLPFYIYTNENIFRNLEFASFPTFKDFIKEELYLPKNWRSEKVQFRGSTYYKAEIIRFALFPLKEGELLIDPLKMRFEVDADVFDILQGMMGKSQEENREAQTFLRSSGALPITVKPLPPKPAGITQNEIAVGKYNILVTPPKNDLLQNEAFTIKVRVEGRGNIKGIPEPEIQVPSGIQKSKTQTDYSVNTMSEGYKDFDLLMVPRNSGSMSIPENKWTYFDPDKKTYETLTIPSIELKINPSNRKNLPGEHPGVNKDVIYAGQQDFEKESAPAVPLWLWTFPTLVYACAAFLFVQRRKYEQEEALLQSMPWLLIERKIHAQHDFSTNEALGLVEEWILRRFQVLNIQEAAFDDLIENLRRRVPANVDAKVEKLRERFKQIEFARFSGKRKNTLNLSFEEIKKLSEEIIAATPTAAMLSQAIEDEDD